MSSSFINLCNRVLRRLNEVEIAAEDFDSVRGIQALVQDAARDSIAKINQAEYEWPFNAADHTQDLVAGQSEYTWPTFFKVADWNSFQIQKNSTQGVGFSTLRYIERDEWYQLYRDEDNESGVSGAGVPAFVFSSHGSGFGVSPSPNKPYQVRFRYFLNFSALENPNDISRIPDTFDSVIIDGALYHLYLFKDNIESAQAAYIAFEQGIKNMQSIYINNYEKIRDRRVNF
jgi:hypothetical protein